MVLNPRLFVDASKLIGCEPEALMAITMVETPYPHRGDSPHGPIILNERHIFYRYLDPKTRDQLAVQHPTLISKRWGGYCTGRTWLDRQKAEHARLVEKMNINRQAALMSVSMGMFQIMGFNFSVVGYKSVEEMWATYLLINDKRDIEDGAKFILNSNLARHLISKNWAAFAKGYNGPSYAKNKYDIKMNDFYNMFKAMNIDFSTPRVIEIDKMPIKPLMDIVIDLPYRNAIS